MIRQIEINAQCIMLQLCFRAQTIRKFEQLGGLKHIADFKHRKFSNNRNKFTFYRTIIQYCSENQSIRLTGPPIFFVNTIFEILHAHYALDADKEDRDFATQRVRRLCFASLSNLSLVKVVQNGAIWK